MESDDDQLAAIERALRRDDPGLHRRFAAFAYGSRRHPSGWALAASGACVIAAGFALAASVRWHSAFLLVVAIVVFSLSGLPVGRRRSRLGDHQHGGGDGLA